MRKWEELPDYMKTDSVRKYYDILDRRRGGLAAKRIFDFILALLLTVILLPVLLIISIMIKLDSRGPVFFRQVRITSCGNEFRIFKFRTMVVDADKLGTQVTTKGDSRITKVGHMLRKCRLDEIPQLFNVITGEMTFVGTRPEVPKYVAHYADEMNATLLLPAGITSRTSIEYKDEEKLLGNAENADEVYIQEILPAKMKYNLEALKGFSFWGDIKTMFDTISAVIK